METFIPVENDKELWRKLREIKQSGSVADYNTAFRHITMQISNLSFPEAEYEYLRGLYPKIRDLIQTKDNIRDSGIAVSMLST